MRHRTARIRDAALAPCGREFVTRDTFRRWLTPRRWLTTIPVSVWSRLRRRTPMARSSGPSARSTRSSSWSSDSAARSSSACSRPASACRPSARLAEQLELSRSTVREALRLLYDAGYLEARRGRRGGVFVAQQLPTGPAPGMLALDGDGVRDLLAYRRCLELGAAELAAERASEAQIAELAAVIERCEANATPETYDLFRAADGRFHVLHRPRRALAAAGRRRHRGAGRGREPARLRAAPARGHGRLDDAPPPRARGDRGGRRRGRAAGDARAPRRTERLLLGVLPSV